MASNTQTVSKANDTLAKRRQTNNALLELHKQNVYKKLPNIDNIAYEINSLGAEYTMAMLAKNNQYAKEIKQRMYDLEQKRRDLLLENGFPADYLDPIYTCPICKDKGFVNGKICACLKKEIIKQRQNMLTCLSPAPKCTFEQFSLDFYPDTADQNNINPRQQMSKILSYCKRYAETFGASRRSILMLGSSGLGKTHLSCSIADKCIQNGFVVMYASSQSMFEQFENSRYDVQDIVNDIISCDLFILDDLGTEYITAHGLSILYNIVNSRMLSNAPCIFSTNLTSQKALTAKYGEKIVSRILGSCDTLYFVGEDIRFKKKEI